MLDILLYLTIIFAFSTFILTFHPIFKDIIALRFFSALMLYGAMTGVSATVMFVGFGSTSVITYATSQAGDPGRLGELEVFQDGFGYMAVWQIFWGFILMAKYVFSGGKGEMNEIDAHAERYA